MDEIKQEQMRAIKNRLFAQFCKSDLTIYKLLEEVKQVSGFSLNYDTFRRTIEPSSTTLDIYSVIALCQYWNLDVSYVLSPPDMPDTGSPDTSTTSSANYTALSEQFHVLDDPKYTGTFYGYLYSAKKINSYIEQFELNIEKVDGQMKADMTYHAITNPNGTCETELIKHFSGVPILAGGHVIFMVLTNDSGEFFILSYNYTFYRRRNMYFKQGFLISCATDIARPILMQKCVLFSQPVLPEKMPYISGFLLLNDRTFHLPTQNLEVLKKSYPEVKKVFDHLSYLLEHSKKEIYDINETLLLNSYTSELSVYDILHALMLMKGTATDATRITVTEDVALSEFSKLLR